MRDLRKSIWGNELKELDKSMRKSGEEYLAKVAKRLNEQGITTTSDVDTGDPAHVIIEFANKKQVSIIAMSTHGRSGIARWVLGSVADKVLHGSAKPMWLVRPWTTA